MLLSIVVPAYNEGEHIYDNLMVIDGAISKITPDYEIIAVNDGSPDNTGAEVARAASDNPHIRDCGYEVNRGKGGAVTNGINNSRGNTSVSRRDAGCSISRPRTYLAPPY